MPLALIERPLGRLPDHVYGETPPVAARFAEYAAPTVPAGKAVVVIASGAGAPAVPPEASEAPDAPLKPTISMA